MDVFNYRKSGWLASLGIHIICFLIMAYSGFFSNMSVVQQTPDTEIYVADKDTSAGNRDDGTESSGLKNDNASPDDILLSQDESQMTADENKTAAAADKTVNESHKVPADNFVKNNNTQKTSGDNITRKGKISGNQSGNGAGNNNEGSDAGNGSNSGSGGGDGAGNSDGEDVAALKAAVMPVPLNAPKPSYPYAMRSSGIEGAVRVRFSVDASGNVESVSVISSSGGSAFNEAALSAAYRWTFFPARNTKGQPVRCFISQTFYFKMDQA